MHYKKRITLLRENSLCKIGFKYIRTTTEISINAVISIKYTIVHHCVHSPVTRLLILQRLLVS